MIASIINFSQLEDRIDAEYFKPEYLKLEKILNNQENITELNSLAKEINCGPFGSLILKEHYLNKGLPLLRITNLKDIIIDEEDLVFINQELDNKLKKYIVNPYDIKKTAERIVELLNNREKRINFGMAGYNRVLEKFSLDYLIDKTVIYYKK